MDSAVTFKCTKASERLRDLINTFGLRDIALTIEHYELKDIQMPSTFPHFWIQIRTALTQQK